MANDNKCPQCGASIDPGSTVCKYCGESVASPVQQQAPPAAPYQPPPGPYAAPQPMNPNMAVPQGYEQKSKLVAGLLQIFLGSFGVGRFYLGFVGIGIAQILVTWCTFGIGALWPLIDGILILTGSVSKDARGIPLKE
jgi:hypothetical protein